MLTGKSRRTFGILNSAVVGFFPFLVLLFGCSSFNQSYEERNHYFVDAHSYMVSDDLADADISVPGHSLDTVASDTSAVDTVSPSIYSPNLRYGVDTSVNPCEDFYEYANGQWRKDVVFPAKYKPAQKSWNNFSALPKRTDQLVRDLIINAHKAYSTSSSTSIRAIGTFYESCMVADSLELSIIRRKPRPGEKDSTRAEKCVSRTRKYLPGAVGQAFVESLQQAGSVERMQLLLDMVRVQVRVSVEHHRLKTKEDIRLTLNQLDKLYLRVGIPEKTVDYSAVNLSKSDYNQNKVEIANFNSLGSVNLIGSDSRERWKMNFFTANAFYNSAEHAIEVPPGMFTPPFFEAGADDAVNFAAVGVIIGHEIFHSLAANLLLSENPKMKEEIDSFKAMNSRLGEVDGWTTDGKRTYNEDVADLGGVIAAYRAWKELYNSDKKNTKETSIDGYTPDQRFFLAYGRVWRAKWVPQTAAINDVHAAYFARINGIVRHVPEFAAAFGCKERDPMALPANRRSKLW